MTPEGGWTFRGGGLTANLYIRQTVPSYRGTQRCTWDYSCTIASLLFFSITDQDCVTLPYVDISTLTPPMDEVVVACPPGHNNNDAHGQAIYVRAVTDPGGGTTHACSSSSSKLIVRDSAIRHHLQDNVQSQMLQSG
jgi:hypothetical protein